jgi:hypothetical protein
MASPSMCRLCEATPEVARRRKALLHGERNPQTMSISVSAWRIPAVNREDVRVFQGRDRLQLLSCLLIWASEQDHIFF